MFFNEYKTWVLGNDDRNLTAYESFLGGMSAGCFSTLGNNPFGRWYHDTRADTITRASDRQAGLSLLV